MSSFIDAFADLRLASKPAGIRRRKPANRNSIDVSRLRGFYIHPEFYGAPPEKQIEWARHPQMMKKMQETRARQLAAPQKQTVEIAFQPAASAPATIELLQALRRNEMVAIQGDHVYQRHTFDVPFFSQPTSFPLGPFLLSQVSGAPVLPVFVIRQGWLRYQVLMGDLIPAVPSRVKCGDGDAGLYEAMCHAVRFLEKTLTIHYDQWMNYFDFWPVAPRD
jgi:predicted LPLAT superfamily acyltransferase